MQLRQWYADGFAQDSVQLTRTTTVVVGLRYEYMSPLRDLNYTNTNLVFQNGTPFVFIGGQQGFPEGLMYSRRTNFAPRIGISQNIPRYGTRDSHRLWHLLYAGGHEHLVQSASQRAVSSFPRRSRATISFRRSTASISGRPRSAEPRSVSRLSTRTRHRSTSSNGACRSQRVSGVKPRLKSDTWARAECICNDRT